MRPRESCGLTVYIFFFWQRNYDISHRNPVPSKKGGACGGLGWDTHSHHHLLIPQLGEALRLGFKGLKRKKSEAREVQLFIHYHTTNYRPNQNDSPLSCEVSSLAAEVWDAWPGHRGCRTWQEDRGSEVTRTGVPGHDMTCCAT